MDRFLLILPLSRPQGLENHAINYASRMLLIHKCLHMLDNPCFSCLQCSYSFAVSKWQVEWQGCCF